MTIIQDIEEFMKIPYGNVILSVAVSLNEDMYLKKAVADMFPWGVKEGDMWDFYRSDKYSAYLFWKVGQEMEENRQHVPQTFANIAEGYFTQPRILIYGCGTGLVALTLRMMHLEKDRENFKDITIADIPGKYFEFLKFMSEKYGLGFRFIPLEKGKDCLNKRYDLILFNSAFGQDPVTVLRYLVDHLEEIQYIYLNAITLKKSSYHYPDLVKVEGMGMHVPVSTDDSAWRIWQKKLIVIPQQEEVKVPAKVKMEGIIRKNSPIEVQEEVKVPANVKGDRIFPASIACLSTLPGTACGIATYTNMLSQAISKLYPVSIFRDINQNVPKDALILASIEFGIFEKTSMLLNPAYEKNWKFAIWHTVVRDPFKGYMEYLQDIDAEYDAHIVHTIVQKAWLSKFVEKPIYIIPHGTMIWEPIPKDEAKVKFKIPQDIKIAFVFGFAAENKGLEELIEVSNKINATIPDFRIVISAGVNSATKEATEYTGNLKNNLKKAAQSSGTIVLGEYLTEEEINLWVSAADMLVFNYRTPPYVASASGAMKRVLAAGKPIICVDDNRLEELVEGEHCLKFKPSDQSALTRCIETLLSDRERADALGQNCRRLAERTSWERVADKFMDI
ncbi:MAG: glycosyltransferase, partial [Flavobacteriaceae bacterium]|nr:glycosyltransferase [Flavobacteriaceae bacterium]